MATESLIVLLDAKTEKLDSSLKKTQGQLDNLDGKTRKVDTTLNKLTASAKIGAFAVTALASAIAVATNEAVAFARELDIASQRSGQSVEEMQRLAFATNTVGISLEKLGDIAKDTNEKIGEFVATGGGGFQDFVDVMGLSKMEANELAQELSHLSGTEVLQEMVKRMQEAGVAGQQMSFALEGMASDATDLIPLLLDNAKAMETLKGEFDGLDALISEEDLAKVSQLGIEFDKFKKSFSAEGVQLIANYSEEITKVLGVILLMAQKANDAFNLITTSFGNLVELAQSAFNDFVDGTETFDEVLKERQEKTIEAINQLFGTDYYEVGVEAGKNLADGIADGVDENKKPLEIVIKKGQEMAKDGVKNDKNRLDNQRKFIRASKILANEFLEDNKAINAGLIVADTASGIMKAFATSSNIYEAFANASIVAATGLVQLNNALSASKGGGSISGGSGAGGGSSTAQQPTSVDDPETSRLELTEQDEGGVNELVIRFATDSGDNLLDALAEGLNERQRQGR